MLRLSSVFMSGGYFLCQASGYKPVYTNSLYNSIDDKSRKNRKIRFGERSRGGRDARPLHFCGYFDHKEPTIAIDNYTKMSPEQLAGAIRNFPAAAMISTGDDQSLKKILCVAFAFSKQQSRLMEGRRKIIENMKEIRDSEQRQLKILESEISQITRNTTSEGVGIDCARKANFVHEIGMERDRLQNEEAAVRASIDTSYFPPEHPSSLTFELHDQGGRLPVDPVLENRVDGVNSASVLGSPPSHRLLHLVNPVLSFVNVPPPNFSVPPPTIMAPLATTNPSVTLLGNGPALASDQPKDMTVLPPAPLPQLYCSLHVNEPPHKMQRACDSDSQSYLPSHSSESRPGGAGYDLHTLPWHETQIRKVPSRAPVRKTSHYSYSGSGLYDRDFRHFRLSPQAFQPSKNDATSSDCDNQPFPERTWVYIEDELMSMRQL